MGIQYAVQVPDSLLGCQQVRFRHVLATFGVAFLTLGQWILRKTFGCACLLRGACFARDWCWQDCVCGRSGQGTGVTCRWTPRRRPIGAASCRAPIQPGLMLTSPPLVFRRHAKPPPPRLYAAVRFKRAGRRQCVGLGRQVRLCTALAVQPSFRGLDL